MFAKTILFPTDFSETTDAGLKYATSFARDTGARLVIVHVHAPVAYGGELGYVVPDTDETALRKQLEAVVPADPAIEHEHRLLHGDPASEIVRLAEEEHADLIVMGTHGRTGLMRLLMGSVAEAVVRRAPCPVLTIRQPHEVPAATA
jgi:universal stress protein A